MRPPFHRGGELTRRGRDSERGLERARAHADVEALTRDEREAAAHRWTRLGQLEHASIAAFARFSLQLLALGAPAVLVDECTRALADETAHARRCFALASAYAGHAVGPGPLDIEGSLTPVTLIEVVDLVIAEGCWGETAAALEALRESADAEDPLIAVTFRQIAEDEQRHAELAFRFLRWAFDRDQAAVTERILAAQQTHEWSDHPARAVVTPCFDALVRVGQGAGGVRGACRIATGVHAAVFSAATSPHAHPRIGGRLPLRRIVALGRGL